MKNAIKNKRVLLTALISFLAGVLVNMGIWLIITFALTDVDYSYNYTLGFYILLAAFLLAGWVSGNQAVNKHRRKEKNWDGPVPENVRESAWKRRWSFFLPALGFLAIIAFCEIFYFAAGHYPFLGVLG